MIMLLSLLAHGITDFLLQPQSVLDKKSDIKLTGYLYHGAALLICMLILLFPYMSTGIILYCLLITLTHMAVDWVKCIVSRYYRGWFKLWAGVTDQLLHIIVIIAMAINFDIIPRPAFSPFTDVHSLPLEQVAIVITAYVYVLFGGNFLVRAFLDCIDIELPATPEARNSGKYIGIMERAIVLTLTLNDSLSAIAFILAAKSIARFAELNNRAFAEYYIIGTLLSSFIAISAGLLVVKIILPAL